MNQSSPFLRPGQPVSAPAPAFTSPSSDSNSTPTVPIPRSIFSFVITILVASLVLSCTLAWNDALAEWFLSLFPGQDKTAKSKFMFALFATALVVLLLLIIGWLTRKKSIFTQASQSTV